MKQGIRNRLIHYATADKNAHLNGVPGQHLCNGPQRHNGAPSHLLQVDTAPGSVEGPP